MKYPIQIIVLIVLLFLLNPFLFGSALKAKDSTSSEKPPYEMSIEVMQKQFEAGFEASGFLHDFAYALESHELPYIEVVDKYLSIERKKKRLLSNRNQKFIYHFAVNAQSQALDILLQEKLSFAESYGLHNIDKKIKTALFNSTLQAAFTQNEQLFKRVKQLTRKAHLDDYTEFIYALESKYLTYLKDWKSYIKVTYDYMDKYNGTDPIFLNNQAISILKVVENTETLNRARKWTEQSILLDPQNYNHQTYAYILYKLGDVRAAKIAASKALKYNQSLPTTELKVNMPNSDVHKTRNHLKT